MTIDYVNEGPIRVETLKVLPTYYKFYSNNMLQTWSALIL